mgnify:CR=1 FL=1
MKKQHAGGEQQQVGQYTLVRRLGEGGMGAVYRARDTKLNRDVAIKVLLPDDAGNPERLARFQREAQVPAALNHLHIAQIYGLESREGQEGQEGREGRDGREGRKAGRGWLVGRAWRAGLTMLDVRIAQRQLGPDVRR